MNREYIVEFNISGHYYIPVRILAENNELALNQAQGMIHGEWVNLVDIDGNSMRVRSNKVYSLRCYEK